MTLQSQFHGLESISMNNANRIITDLPEYIRKTDGIIPLITMTGDPPHVGHVHLGVRTIEEALRRNIRDEVLYLVHNRNELKDIEGSLEDRQRWMLMNFDWFEGRYAEKVKICTWGAEKDQPYIYDLIEAYQRQLLRVAGSDKERKDQKGYIEMCIFPRVSDKSSTEVKRLMRITGSHPKLREALAPQVYEEIMDRGIYRGRVGLKI